MRETQRDIKILLENLRMRLNDLQLQGGTKHMFNTITCV